LRLQLEGTKMLFYKQDKSLIFLSASMTIGLSSCIISTVLLFGGAAQAQVKISPLLIEKETNRGQANEFITVYNPSDQPFRARVYAEPFTYQRDAGFKSLSSSPTNLIPYLQFAPRELTVPPRSMRRVRISVRLAPNLLDGEYRAMIFTEPLKESSNGNRGATIVTRVGSAFYIRKGNLQPNLTVDSANWNNARKRIQLLVNNSGKISARPKVNWTLRHEGKVVKSGLEDETTIVAESDRNIILTSPTPSKTPTREEPSLTPGTYQLSGELVWGKDDKKKQSFNLNLTIPTQTSEKK
jgi:hypothetical protein